jgi:nitroimidazol reductase NimA-like FMN-containing flavoprotein (pyridoxamine 5'-phosphate oxidase superfamily)
MEVRVEHPAVSILNAHRIMAISTVRPDGWPQTTIVGYANQGFDIVFLIFKKSQKLENIQHDDRISIAVAPEPVDMKELQAVYAGAHAAEITEEGERQRAWQQLMQRHANLAGFQMPDTSEAVFIRAKCKYVSMLDFTQGPGHREQSTLDDNGARVEVDLEKDKWGDEAALKPAS